MSTSPFKWVGGRLSLDFVNTVGARNHGEAGGYTVRDERLRSWDDVEAWVRESGLTVDGEAVEDPGSALERAIALREALYRIFRAVARAEAADSGDLDALSREVLATREGERLVAAQDGGFLLRPSLAPGSPSRWLGPIVASAVELLTSPALARVRQCAGDDCGWLFEDTSRTGRRRWCDMKDCGNLAKVRRFRAREQGSVASRK